MSGWRAQKNPAHGRAFRFLGSGDASRSFTASAAGPACSLITPTTQGAEYRVLTPPMQRSIHGGETCGRLLPVVRNWASFKLIFARPSVTASAAVSFMNFT